MEYDALPWARALNGIKGKSRTAGTALIALSSKPMMAEIGESVVIFLLEGAKTMGRGVSSIAVEGMSYEDAHSDGHGCGLFRLHIIDTAFGARAGSGQPGSAGTAEFSVSCCASFGGGAHRSCSARCSWRSRTTCCPAVAGYSGVGKRAFWDGVYASGRWTCGGLL